MNKDKKNINDDNEVVLDDGGVDSVEVDVKHDALLLEMAKAGVMYGHKKTRHDPHFKKYIFTIKNGIEIIDLEQTLEKIEEVSNVLSEFKKDDKSIMVVGVQSASHESVKKLSEKLGASYVINKWIGGLITNFGVISKRIELFKERSKSLETGKYDSYTKKERLMMQREVNKMAKRFEGLEDYSKTPDVVFIIDSSIKNHATALSEARRRGSIIIGIIDNDDDPEKFDYIIPANDHTSSSINWVINRLIDNIK